LIDLARVNSIAIYIEKQSIIVIHAEPNTQPGGVHGALFNSAYQSELAPLPAKIPPSANAPKFRIKNQLF